MSPQLEELEGAKAGMFVNSVTKELFKTLRVIPVYFVREFLRWVDRDAGGGFRGAYSPAQVETLLASGEALRSEDNTQIMIGENERLSDTRQHYVLFQDASGNWSPAILACASTQIKKSKNWMTLINNFQVKIKEQFINPPSWARIYSVTSTKESNAKGSWHGILIAPEITEENPTALISDPVLYALGKKFYEQIVAGRVRVQHEDLEQGSAKEDGDDEESF